MWPVHCVRDTPGFEFCAALARGAGDEVVRKGTLAAVDSYSGFGDARRGRYERTRLEALLRGRGVTHVAVAGLALDFCVAFTALDAARLGFATYLVLDGCRAVMADKAARELERCAAAGVVVVQRVEDLPAAFFPRVG
jgi:nicotinamidase/pyrazinamidase